jgi:hypothetical protein
VAGMDTFEKLRQLTTYKQIDVIDFESKVEDTYLHTVKRLENDKFKQGFKLSDNDFLEIINTITKAIKGPQKDQYLEFLNFMYDHKKKRIKVYSNEKWEEYLVEKGLQYVVTTIAEYYLETYECYQIRHICAQETVSPQESHSFYLCLEEYYKFIAAFDVEPFVKGKNDNQVMYNKDDARHHNVPSGDDFDAHDIVDRFNLFFGRIDDALTKAERRAIHKTVLDIIKTNAKDNVDELDKEVMNLLRIDDTFKELMKTQSALPL